MLKRVALKVEEEADFTASVATHDNCIRQMIRLTEMSVNAFRGESLSNPIPNPTLA